MNDIKSTETETPNENDRSGIAKLGAFLVSITPAFLIVFTPVALLLATMFFASIMFKSGGVPIQH